MTLNQGQFLILFIDHPNNLNHCDMQLRVADGILFSTLTYTDQDSFRNRPPKGNL